MKKIVLWTSLLLILLLMLGCVKKAPPSYVQEKFSDVISVVPEENTTEISVELPEDTQVVRTLNVCGLGEIQYYEYGVFIYHMDAKESHIVYTPKGEYIKPAGYPRWQYKKFVDDYTLYNKTKKYIDDRQFPNGEAIVCDTINKTPVKFDQFIGSHEQLYKK